MCIVQHASWIMNAHVLSASKWSTTMEKAKGGVWFDGLWPMGGED